MPELIGHGCVSLATSISTQTSLSSVVEKSKRSGDPKAMDEAVAIYEVVDLRIAANYFATLAMDDFARAFLLR